MALTVLLWHLLCYYGTYCVIMALTVLLWHLLCYYGIYCVIMALTVLLWHLLCYYGTYCVIMAFTVLWHILTNLKKLRRIKGNKLTVIWLSIRNQAIIVNCETANCNLTLQLPETHIADFANSVDLDEVAHFEPPHLDLHYLPSSLWILSMIWLGLHFCFKICRRKFCRLLFGSERVKSKSALQI